MLEVTPLFTALAAAACLAVLGWLFSVAQRDVSIVDSVWGMFFVVAALTYARLSFSWHPRALLVLAMVALWATRLTAYITWRNRGHEEDRRYRQIRARNQPGFAFKSLYLVFAMQALLAWFISLPILAAIGNPAPLTPLDCGGALVWAFGLLFESIGDWQLARFKRDPRSQGKVLDGGLWGFTRHPNYFGEATLWWGFFLVAWAAGAWWTVLSPVLMTVLLLKVSGVTLLERDIQERRPAYRDYIARTSAFFPWPPRNAS